MYPGNENHNDDLLYQLCMWSLGVLVSYSEDLNDSWNVHDDACLCNRTLGENLHLYVCKIIVMINFDTVYKVLCIDYVETLFSV
jgi:hypothetical protein